MREWVAIFNPKVAPEWRKGGIKLLEYRLINLMIDQWITKLGPVFFSGTFFVSILDATVFMRLPDITMGISVNPSIQIDVTPT